MRRLMPVLLLIVLFLPLLTAHAQGEQNWYFAWDSESGSVVAYDTAGTANLLLTAEEALPYAWRLNTDSALAVLSVNGVFSLYELTATSAQPFSAPPDLPLNKAHELVVRNEQYAVLTTQAGALGTSLLLDLTAKTITPLGDSYVNLDTWRLSGDVLRYLRLESQPEMLWAIRERTLSTGVERIIYQFNNPYPNIQPDSTGENWLYRVLQPDPRLLQHTLIRADGTTQIIAEEPLSDAMIAYTAYHLFEDQLLVFTAPCPATCQIEVRSLTGETVQVFPLAVISSPQMQPLARLDENRLLLLIDNQFWLLKNEGAIFLGIFDGVSLSTPPDELISADRHWLLLADAENTSFRLIDLATETTVHQGERGGLMSISYESGGAIIRQFAPDRTLLYPYNADELIGLPGSFYFSGLADGTLLYAQTQETVDRAPGIYRYNPLEGTFSLLVENVFPLEMR